MNSTDTIKKHRDEGGHRCPEVRGLDVGFFAWYVLIGEPGPRRRIMG